jgi:Tfp pilus assembly protein PilO
MNFDPKNRQHLLLLGAVVVVGLFLGERLVFSPLAKAWKNRSERVATLKRDVERGERLIERAESLKSRWAQMSSNSLPTEAAAAESLVLGAFDRWARSSGASVSSIRPQWKRADNDYMTLECRADVGGNLSQITRFLYEVERDPTGVKVDRATIATRDTDGAVIAMDLQVSGVQLVQVNPTQR